MGTLGTFDSFTTARLGIYAAQHGLKVTGNNISNINTAGYTRQRIDQVSFKTGRNDRYKSMLDNHVGSGALVTGINQIRDPYLDIRFRTTTTDTNYHDTRLGGLEEIASILDEVGKGIKDGDKMSKGDGLLYAQLQDLSTKLRAFSADPTSSNDTLVRGAAENLTSMFNNYAQRLEKLREDYDADFKANITVANKVLTNIRDLNKSIRECEIAGDNALEMRDERNRQIDELSKYMSINVQYSMEDIGAGILVEKLTIFMGDSNPDPSVESDSSMLVDGLYCTQLSVPEKKPVLNQYKDITQEDIDKDPGLGLEQYMYLKDYLYTKKVTLTDDERAALNADGITPVEAGIDNKDNKLYLMGTNDAAAEGILTEENDNYTVQLGKLLNAQGVEWKKETTDWVKLENVGRKAVYEFTFSDSVNDPPTIPGSISINGAVLDTSTITKLSDLAAAVAEKLNNDPNYTLKDDYIIKSDGEKIIFTANEIGEVGKDGPAEAVSLTLTGGGDLQLDATKQDSGKDGEELDTTGSYEVDPLTGTEISVIYKEMGGDWYKIIATTEHTHEIALDDNDLYGSLQAQRELLTEEGEFCSDKDVSIDENAAIKRGIPYYIKSFDLLAQKFAEAYNELNTGYALNEKGNYINEKGDELTIEGKPINRYKELEDNQKAKLEQNNLTLDQWLENSSKLPNGAVKMGGPLFSNHNDGDDTTGITASNITISHSWSHGAVNLVPKFEVLFGGDVEHSTQNINADHMVSMIDKALKYNPADLNGSDASGPLLFEGSFNDMFSNMMGVQANDASMTNVRLITSSTTLVELDSSREGVSGVDLNDEAMNMMQFQKAYSAACRLMTMVDEALDRLINNTGIVGR